MARARYIFTEGIILTRFRSTSGGPLLTLWVRGGIQGGKRHSGREEAFWKGFFSSFLLKFVTFTFFLSSLCHGESICTLGFEIGPQIRPGQKCTHPQTHILCTLLYRFTVTVLSKGLQTLFDIN